MAILQKRLFLLVAVLTALLLGLPRLAHAVGEQTGRITGRVTDANTKKPLGGIEVTLTSTALISGSRTTVTEDDGTYDFIELPPGSYDVAVGLPGTKPARRRVVVRQGETTPLNVAWSAELTDDKVQTYQITEEAHLTRPDSAKQGTVLGASKEAKLATARSYQNILTQVAGVSAFNPGGSNIPVIRGANRLQNRYLVDGLDVTDPVTNNFSTQVNFDSIGSVEIITGGFEAQYNALGGIINIITSQGSNKLHIDTSFYINHGSFGVGSQYGRQLYDRELPFSEAPGVNTQNYQANFNISGPLIKNKLWANFSIQYDYIERSIPIGPPLNIQIPPRQDHNFFPRLKLTWAPSTKHLVTISGNGDPAFIRNREQSNGILPVGEYGQYQGGAFGVVQWDYFHSKKWSTQVQAGYNFNSLGQLPQGQFVGGVDFGPRDPRFSDANYTYEPERPRQINNDDGSTWYNSRPTAIDRRHTVQLDASGTVRGRAAGSHEARFGVQTRFAYHSFFRHTPGGTTYSSTGGGTLEAGLCNPETGVNCNTNSLRTDAPDFGNNQFGASVGVYAQDRWRINSRFVLLPGFRVDWGYTRNSLGQTVSSLVGFGPRIGFTVDLTGDGKTILSGHYGRSNDVLNLLAASRADVDAPQTRYRWDPACPNGRGTTGGFADGSSTGCLNAVGGTPVVRIDQSSGGAAGYRLAGGRLNPPHTDEVTGSLRREIYQNSVAGVTYTYRRISNIWDAIEINQIWDPSGVRVVGYANGQNERILLYDRPDGNYRKYHSVDFVAEGKPSKHWDLYAAYTLSWLFGTGSDTVGGTVGAGSAFANPRQFKYFDGYLAEDSRHQFKVQASYARAGFVFGVNANYATGSPLSARYFNATTGQFDNRRSSQGTNPGANLNDVAATAAFRLPDTLLFNVRVSYDFHAVLHQHLIAIVDLFNIFNIDTPLTLETRNNTNYGQATGARQAPFRFQIGLRYNY